MLGAGFPQAFVEPELLARDLGHCRVDLDDLDFGLWHVGGEVLGQRAAATAHDEHAQALALGASCPALGCQGLDAAGHFAVILASQLEAKAFGHVTHALEGSVYVDEPHRGAVGVLGVEDQREAEHGPAHLDAAATQQSGHSGDDYGEHGSYAHAPN